MVAQPVSVAPYTLCSTSPNASMNASDTCGCSADPPHTTTRSDTVAVVVTVPASSSRWSIIGTAISVSALCSSIARSVAAGSKRRESTTGIPIPSPTDRYPNPSTWNSGGAITIGAPDRTGTRIRWLSAAGSTEPIEMSCRAPLGVPVVPEVITTTLLTRPGITGSAVVASASSSSVSYVPPPDQACTRRPPNEAPSTTGSNSSSWTSRPTPRAR